MVVGKGMGGLIAKDSEAVRDRILSEFDHMDSLATYDPLMASYWMLMCMALQNGGLYLMGEKPGDGGEYCPLCEVEAAGVRVEGKAGLAVDWMEGCTDSVLVYCRDNGLLSKPQ